VLPEGEAEGKRICVSTHQAVAVALFRFGKLNLGHLSSTEFEYEFKKKL
jgi:hypothetical protein